METPLHHLRISQGNLKVPVTVNDGQNESNRFELKIEVIKGAECCAKNYRPGRH